MSNLKKASPLQDDKSKAAALEHELFELGNLLTSVMAMVDSYESLVEMPHTGRIAAVKIESQLSLLHVVEKAIMQCQRVEISAKGLLTNHPNSFNPSDMILEARELMAIFSSLRGRCRAIVSSLRQKMIPVFLRLSVSRLLETLKEVTGSPRRVTVRVSTRMENNADTGVSCQVFDATVCLYATPAEEANGDPYFNQFVVSQSTFGPEAVTARAMHTGADPLTDPVPLITNSVEDLIIWVLNRIGGWKPAVS